MLSTFCGPTFFALDEMHLIGQNIAHFVFDMLTMDLNKSTNTATKVPYTPTQEELDEQDTQEWPYTFHIPKSSLKEIGQLVDQSRATIPTSFNNTWNNPIISTSHYRAVDWIEFITHLLPLVFAHYIPYENCRQAVVKLSCALKLALQWEVTQEDQNTIEE